jgi:rhomboid family GlyGly-CTERM serine protease
MNSDVKSPQDSRPPVTAGWRFAPVDWVPIILATLSFAAMLGGIETLLWLRYDRAKILGGEAWRIVTGHIVHLGWMHFFLNLAGLALIWLLFGRIYTALQWGIVVLACAVGISLGFMFMHPELTWYVGLSGVLHGMFVAGAVASLFAGNRAEWLLLGLLIVKMVWEQLRGSLAETEHLIGGLVIVDAHLYGALIGLAIALAFRVAARP